MRKVHRIIGKNLRGEPRQKLLIGEFGEYGLNPIERTRTYSLYEPEFGEVQEVVEKVLIEKFEDNLGAWPEENRVRVKLHEFFGADTTRRGSMNHRLTGVTSEEVEEEIVHELRKEFGSLSIWERMGWFFSHLF